MGKTGAGKYRSFFALQKKTGTSRCVRCSRSAKYLQPPSHFVTAPWGARGKDSPIPLLSLRSACAYLRAHTFTPTSHFVTAPWGALGTEFPRPLASLRTVCAYLYPPSHFVTAPWGARGKDSPIPLLSLRSDGALGALGVAFMGGMVGKKTTVCGFCRSLCSLGSCGGTGCLCREGKR